MRTILAACFGIVGGLLGAGVLLLVAGAPRGQPVELKPPPTAAPIIVHVSGAVGQPGVYPLPEGSRIQDAIESAGGLQNAAEPLALNLAARLEDGDQLWIPAEGEADLQLSPGSPASTPVLAPQDGTTPARADGLIEINTASQAELESLPGIGPVTASKIIAYREEKGLFKTVEQILDVPGIGPATFERIKDLITVTP
jgi:competence protein ComEA